MEEWEVEKILNKRKIQEVDRYLVRWKGFTTESNIWEKEKNLEHAKELVNEFEEAEVRRQEREEVRGNVRQNPRVDKSRRMELPEKYMAKLLYRWDDGKFKVEYLRKLERN